MSAPTFETISHNEGLPPPERTLPSAITRRIMFQLAPIEGALPFTPHDALGLDHALHGNIKGQADFRIKVVDGHYLVDFPSSGPVRAAERLARTLFENFGVDFANAELHEARIERAPDDQLGVPMSEAWDHMDDVTRLVDRIMLWQHHQLLADAPSQLRDEIYKL